MSATNYVVDASVGAMLFVSEDLSDRAHELMDGLATEAPPRLHVPDLFYIEVANVLLKALRRGRLAPAEARRAISDLGSLRILVTPTSDLVRDSLEIAQEMGISAYDACYVALSDRVGIPLLTADMRLARILARSSHRVRCLADSGVE
jgi:predicted nucleic acid-binding protein